MPESQETISKNIILGIKMNLAKMINSLPRGFSTDDLLGVLTSYESSMKRQERIEEKIDYCEYLYDLRLKFPGIYGKDAKDIYGTGDELEDCECIYPIQYFFRQPDAKIQIYKACPRSVFTFAEDSRITLSRYRAQKEAHENPGYHVITMNTMPKLIRYSFNIQDCEYFGFSKAGTELRF